MCNPVATRPKTSIRFSWICDDLRDYKSEALEKQRGEGNKLKENL